MNVRAWGILAGAAVLVCALPAPGSALPRGTRVEAYRRGLQFPVDMAWVPGTRRIFFTEKNTGRIRVMSGRRLKRRPCARLDVASQGERGLLGIALHPRFKRNHQLFVYYTNASPLENRVTRFTVRRGRCRNPRHIVRGISASSSGYHNGGQLEFVGGKLFVSTGEAHDPSEAQDTSSRLGKILRYNPDGSIPRDNPFNRPGDRNPVWSYGHRNPFGLAHRPGTRVLFSTENGPQCDDELNVIVSGRNYGWGPDYRCGTAGVGPDPKRPAIRWREIIVPTDPVFYRGRLRSLSGDLYVGDFSEGRLRRILVGRRARVRGQRVIYNHPDGILDVSKGPGGWLYFLTPGGMFRIVRR